MNISENRNISGDVLTLLKTRASGMTSCAVAQALSLPKLQARNALRSLERKGGRVVLCGERGSRYSRWCLPGQEAAAFAAFRRAQAMFHRRQQANRNRNAALRRVKQQTKPATAPRQFKLPKVNSVWSFAA